jgi:hypothetical protein
MNTITFFFNFGDRLLVSWKPVVPSDDRTQFNLHHPIEKIKRLKNPVLVEELLLFNCSNRRIQVHCVSTKLNSFVRKDKILSSADPIGPTVLGSDSVKCLSLLASYVGASKL